MNDFADEYAALFPPDSPYGKWLRDQGDDYNPLDNVFGVSSRRLRELREKLEEDPNYTAEDLYKDIQNSLQNSLRKREG